METFSLEQNRSERALQTHLLAPALASKRCRVALLTGLKSGNAPPIDATEAIRATSMHFVWVLRDAFTAERDAAAQDQHWQKLVTRWTWILGLPKWAKDLQWWRHPAGSYKGAKDYVVHPCQRSLGWTKKGLRKRVSALGLQDLDEKALEALHLARRVLNTESDCFVQTPQRLIVIECKDKTAFSSEQRERQQRLGKALTRLLPRPQPVLHVEVVRGPATPGRWTWGALQELLEAP